MASRSGSAGLLASNITSCSKCLLSSSFASPQGETRIQNIVYPVVPSSVHERSAVYADILSHLCVIANNHNHQVGIRSTSVPNECNCFDHCIVHRFERLI